MCVCRWGYDVLTNCSCHICDIFYIYIYVWSLCPALQPYIHSYRFCHVDIDVYSWQIISQVLRVGIQTRSWVQNDVLENGRDSASSQQKDACKSWKSQENSIEWFQVIKQANGWLCYCTSLRWLTFESVQGTTAHVPLHQNATREKDCQLAERVRLPKVLAHAGRNLQFWSISYNFIAISQLLGVSVVLRLAQLATVWLLFFSEGRVVERCFKFLTQSPVNWMFVIPEVWGCTMCKTTDLAKTLNGFKAVCKQNTRNHWSMGVSASFPRWDQMMFALPGLFVSAWQELLGSNLLWVISWWHIPSKCVSSCETFQPIPKVQTLLICMGAPLRVCSGTPGLWKNTTELTKVGWNRNSSQVFGVWTWQSQKLQWQ